jgi:hypothetical protein
MGGQQRAAIGQALEKGQPLSYDHLLRVGQDAIVTSEYKDETGTWVERALENWLKTSWQYPYGISDGFGGSNLLDDGLSTKKIEYWQDSCFEILTSIMSEYRKYYPYIEGASSRQLRLKQVAQFIDTLGGLDFLSSKMESVNWMTSLCFAGHIDIIQCLVQSYVDLKKRVVTFGFNLRV